MGYEALSQSEGAKYLSKIQNLFFKNANDEEFFVEPWEKRAWRDCSLFGYTSEDGRSVQELLFCTDDEGFLDYLGASSEVILYGAYNQVTVCQMRAKGILQRLQGDEASKVKRELSRKVCGEGDRDRLESPLPTRDCQARLDTIGRGKVFRFLPREYAYMVYERG